MSSARQLAPLAALTAAFCAHLGFFNPYLPLWLKDQGLGLAAISLLVSLQSVTRLVAPYGWGWLSDYTGRRVLLLRYAATVALVASMGLWLPGGQGWLFAVLLVLYAHMSAIMPLGEAALADRVSHEGSLDARRYGRVRVFGSAGFLLSVLAAGWWFEQRGLHEFPAWSQVTLGLMLLAAFWLPNQREPVSPVAHGHMRHLMRQPGVRLFFAAAFFHVLSHMGIYVSFSLYLDALGYGKAAIGMLWSLSVLVEMAWFITQARWLPRLSLPAWLMVCSALMLLRMGLTAGAAEHWWVLALAQALHAFTFATHHTVCIAMLRQFFSGPQQGRAQALYTVLAYGIPGVIGGVAGGWLSSWLGLASVFWVAMATSAIAVALAWALWRQQRPAALAQPA